MVNISSRQKDRLIALMEEERQPARCEIAKMLYAEAALIKAPYKAKMDVLKSKIEELKSQILEIDAAMDNELKERKLYKFYKSNGCEDYNLHPDLVEFDRETTRLEKEILLMK